MNVFSASEAIWPALERTYAYLFRPFKGETFLKLAAVATLSEGFLVSFRFAVPDAFPFEVNTAALRAFLLSPKFLPVTVLAAMAIFLAGVYCVSLVIRLRFAFVHSLIHQTREFRTAARLYSDEAERFFMASMLVWLSFLVAVSLAIVLFAGAAYAVAGTPIPEGKLALGNFLILFLPSIAIVFVLLLAASAAQVVLNDFILPHMVIEGAPFSKAWADVRIRIAANRETFLSFFILRMAMPLVAGLALGAAAWVVGLAVFGILGVSAAGFTAMLDGVPGWRTYLLAAAQTIFTLLGLGAGMVIAVSFAGPIGVFMRSYALLFYGGHYQALGNLLNPPAGGAARVETGTEDRFNDSRKMSFTGRPSAR
jgi:hypothetical protein